MVKYATIRKRSYKKRRTIRKLKTTLRRKIQRGGNPAISTLIFIFLAVFSNSPVVKAFIKILEIFTGEKISAYGGGSSKNFKQSGGGRLSYALGEFYNEIQNDTTIPDDKKKEIASCVDKLKADDTLVSLPTGAPQVLPIVDADSSKLQSVNINVLKPYIEGKIDALKSFILSKAEIMKDPNKKECMKKIFNFGFELMKTKFMSLGLNDLMKAKTAQVKAELAARGSAMFQKFSIGKDEMSAALQQNQQAAAAAAAAKEKTEAAATAFKNMGTTALGKLGSLGNYGWGK
jgi:hypothetical protein